MTTNGALVALPTTALATVDDIAAAWLLGYSNNGTRDGYMKELADWRGWLERYGVDPLEARRAHVEAFCRSVELDGKSPATVARKLAALSSFYRYAVDEGVIERSPVGRVRRPAVSDESTTQSLDREELRAFLETARATGARNAALATLLAMNGLRISEALAADAEGLSTERGHRTLTITRKGGKRAIVPLAAVTSEAIDALLTGRTTGPIFTTRSGRRMVRQEAGKVIVRIARRAGISKRISAHSLRHSFITLALDSGASLRDVQDAAGHADPRQTRRYDRSRHNLDRHPTYAVSGALS